MDTLIEFLKTVLTTGLFDSLNNYLSLKPNDGEYTDVWNILISGTESIFEAVILPIGIGICTLYFLIGLLDKISSEQINLEQFLKAFMKLVIVVYLISNSLDVLNALLNLGNHFYVKIYEKINNNFSSASAITFYDNLIAGANTTTEKFGVIMQLFFPAIASFIAQAIVGFICYSRLIELYLRAMFTPIAVSDIFVGGANSNGFRYLKGFLALAMQNAVIYLIAYIYSIVSAGVVDTIVNGDPSFLDVTIGTLALSFAACGLLLKSLNITKEIVGA